MGPPVFRKPAVAVKRVIATVFVSASAPPIVRGKPAVPTAAAAFAAAFAVVMIIAITVIACLVPATGQVVIFCAAPINAAAPAGLAAARKNV